MSDRLPPNTADAIVRQASRPAEEKRAGLCPADDARPFFAADGVLWTVCEVPAPAEPWARGTAFLLFESMHAIRRVWRFPENWRELDPEALEQLSYAT